MKRHYLFTILACVALGTPSPTQANARLIDVIPLNGGCEVGPTGDNKAYWDVQPGKEYKFIIDDVEECGDDGTDETINVLVRSTMNKILWQGTADLICPGKYEFSFTLPIDSSCEFGIRYCTKPDMPTSGLSVHSLDDDEDKYKVFLRASTFKDGCSCPQMIKGPECCASAARASTWASLKQLYR